MIQTYAYITEYAQNCGHIFTNAMLHAIKYFFFLCNHLIVLYQIDYNMSHSNRFPIC